MLIFSLSVNCCGQATFKKPQTNNHNKKKGKGRKKEMKEGRKKEKQKEANK